jgi:hypothetical protein
MTFFPFCRPDFFAETRLKGLLSAIAVHTQVSINRLEAERRRQTSLCNGVNDMGLNKRDGALRF